ncbi:hypothetical protein AB0E63_16905 [Kribbella sp. NPDC026596]|uniref:hypothetical protein n=1 Tax=Kribbella sp. NPDC026596 TaxID=3155122 RepID=UPI0033E5D7C7
MDSVENRDPAVRSAYDVQRVAEVRGQRPRVLLVIPIRISGDLPGRDLERSVVPPERQVQVMGQVGQRELSCGEIEPVEQLNVPVEVEDVRRQDRWDGQRERAAGHS